MSSTGKLALSRKGGRDLNTPSDQALLTTLQTKANWIWCPDTIGLDGPDPPMAGEGEQCIVRNKFFYPTNKGRPTGATLVIAADDYMALYVDGVEIQPADVEHSWRLIYAFQVPLPVIQNQTASSLLLGIRGINTLGYMGLIVAAQVAYETGDPDIFYTGLSDDANEWRGQRLFDEGWEQPWYNADIWRPADKISQSVRPPPDPVSFSLPTAVAAFEALPASAAPGGRAPIEFSVGEFAGILISSVLGTIIVGAIGACLVLQWRRRAHRSIETWSDNGGVMLQDHVLRSELRSSLPHDIPSTLSEDSNRSTPATLSPFTQMVPSNADQSTDLAPPMYTYSHSETVESSPRRK
ncbi:hypothetical protein FA13DRAFT_1726995 [Coprinellus micaceus]|uniref:Uncharacterized protein n=1 Tax=Coprinellus micaceus TaxID=71717 RepID=A0A4Y7TR19_COPMI|nr:hypothetical protein FA13DRAFT_1726995 [Coprinellus micaceus]